ncbi:MAG TPA: acylphosphatase [Actinomycetes bacterium]|nr:acylphosphatase [Actinomycetes bacterium]
MPPATVRRRVIVYGLVQGVFYRVTTRRLADRRGVSGWVRNRADGSVEAVFEGPSDQVDRMIAWARTGPDRASVDAVEVYEELPEGLAGFAVR